MNARPAGLSDDELDDEECFSFGDEDIPRRFVPYAKKAVTQVAPVSQVDQAYMEEEQQLEFRVMHACMTGHLETIDEYIHLGHHANDFLHTGWTPLLYGASSVQSEVVEHLLDLGADPNKHKDGYTPLMALCSSIKGTTDRVLRCLDLLRNADADVNATNRQKISVLMYACKTGRPEVVSELLKYVKNINFADSEGRTALFYAVTANSTDIVKILLEAEVVTTVADRYNHTAKDIAIAREYEKIVHLLGSESEDMPEEREDVSIKGWRDMFPMLCAKNTEAVNYDVATILYGMGMERYKSLFKGLDLKAFLNLTMDDLIRLGIDIPFQRKQFVEGLHKFHAKKWNVQSMGVIKKYLPYTIYDGVLSLGNAAKQIGIIGSSFRYIKNSLQTINGSSNTVTIKQKSEYSEELKKTQQTLKTLKQELYHVKALAAKIDRESSLGSPAAYIGPKKKKSNWTIILSVTLIAGMYLSRTAYIQKLWNE